MKLSPDFQRTLAEMNDGELSLMLADFENYVPEAITLARAELERRKIPVEEVAHLRQIIQAVSAAPRGFFGDNVARVLVIHLGIVFVAGVMRGC